LALGERIDRAWRAEGYNEQVFPRIAAHALAQSNPSSWTKPYELLGEFLRASTHPPQHKFPFGMPSVVLYSGRHFFIEMLCWTTGTVGIHRHGFSGAFHILLGSSLHSTFDFTPTRRINSRFLIGNLVRTGTELLPTGTTHEIDALGLVHSAFHLEAPSITVVVRTRSEAEAKPQYAYEPPFLAIDRFYDDACGQRQHETLAFLRDTRPSSYRDVFAEYVTTRDLEACFYGLQIAQVDEDLFATILPLAREAHGPEVDLLVHVIQEDNRRAKLVTCRAHFKNSEHRFFLGMLLNLECREDILRMVGARYPGAPSTTILRWVKEMSTTASGDSTFDLRLTDAESDVFKCLLDGYSLSMTLRELARAYGPSEVRGQRSAIEGFYEALRNNEVYRPLFVGPAVPRASASKSSSVRNGKSRLNARRS
jgi:hypothetical protein